jgi:hypothetical protein
VSTRDPLLHYCSSAPFSEGGWGPRGDDHGGGCFVAGVEVEEVCAHGGLVGGADAPGVDAVDLWGRGLLLAGLGGLGEGVGFWWGW